MLNKNALALFSTRNFCVRLGLAVVKDILAQHGGGVEIQSKVGGLRTVRGNNHRLAVAHTDHGGINNLQFKKEKTTCCEKRYSLIASLISAPLWGYFLSIARDIA